MVPFMEDFGEEFTEDWHIATSLVNPKDDIIATNIEFLIIVIQ